MTPPDPIKDHETPPGTFTRLDRTVIILTVVFWTINAVQLSIRALISPSSFPEIEGVELARLASLATGIILTLSMWLALRRLHETRALSWFWRAAALGLVVCVAHTILNALHFRLFTNYHAISGDPVLNPPALLSTYISFLWPIMTWSALCAVMVAGENLRRQQLRTAEALAAAQQAQLAALRLQIQPHFLFNTLNSVSSLIGQNRAREADVAVLRLASFLKHTLGAAPRELVRLDAELEGQAQYLDIEEIRFPDRLRRRLDVADDVAQAMVPSLILQPFVENAVKHGLGPSHDIVTLEVGARRQADRLMLWVVDDGHGDGGPNFSGLGRSLENAAKRLHLLYGPDASLRYGPADGRGWRVDIELPFEVAA